MDGSEVTGGSVTHDAQVSMTIDRHEEKIRLHCTTIGANAPIILGLPWLKLHNPTIDWRAHRLSFNSDKCAERRLTTSPRATAVTEGRGAMESWEICNTVMERIKETGHESHPGKTTEEIVPEEHHDFLGVSTSRENQTPSPHRQQVHRLALQYGTTPPYEPLRPLNAEKMHLLRECIDIKEKRSWIRASTSPAGVPIHFVDKKDGACA